MAKISRCADAFVSCSLDRDVCRPRRGLVAPFRALWGLVLLVSSAVATSPVSLGDAAEYALLSGAAITSTASQIYGDVGSLAAVTCEAVSVGDATNTWLISTQVLGGGRLYASSLAAPTPAKLKAAAFDMYKSYDDAIGRTVSAGSDYTNFRGGIISNKTVFLPGVYKWNTLVQVDGDILLVGSKDDVWIMQVTSYLSVGADVTIRLRASDNDLSSTPQATNVFWQVGAHLILGANAHLEGNCLVTVYTTFGNGATVNGRILSRGAITLTNSVVTRPPPPPSLSPPPSPSPNRPHLLTPRVCLGTAGKFSLLSKAAIKGVVSLIYGDVGGSALTFAPMMVGFDGSFWTSDQLLNGSRLFASSYLGSTPAMLATALADMDAAYADAAACPVSDDGYGIYHNFMTGAIGGSILLPGVYKWDNFVHIATSITLKGGAGDQFLFIVAEYLTIVASMRIFLVADGSNGAPQAQNIVWRISEYLVLGASAHLEGTFLANNYVTFGDQSTLNGRVLSQGAITMSKNTVVAPSPSPADCIPQCTAPPPSPP
ncbi:hypothetical protein T492DRAFT_897633, partial [Pavlovales sp. CCMP2436]